MEDRIHSLRQIFRIADGHSIELCDARERVSTQGARTSVFYKERDSDNQVVAHYRVWTLDASSNDAKQKSPASTFSGSKEDFGNVENDSGISHDLSKSPIKATKARKPSALSIQSGYEKFSPKGELQDREVRYGENWLQDRQLH